MQSRLLGNVFEIDNYVTAVTRHWPLNSWYMPITAHKTIYYVKTLLSNIYTATETFCTLGCYKQDKLGVN
jgi:hypothetical protein